MKDSRRDFLKVSSVSMLSLAIPESVLNLFSKDSKTLSFGVISDLHQDIIPDGKERLESFLTEMTAQKPVALIQLGDFAIPTPENQSLIDQINSFPTSVFHVAGNHDIDGGYSWDEYLKSYGMTTSYYSEMSNGIKIIVLDGNEAGSPTYKSGYFSYIGEKQQNWLIEELTSAQVPVLIVSHQPIAGIYTIDNSVEIQQILSRFSDKILLAINGHAHVDQHIEVEGVNYLHFNSASYYWVGEKLSHPSYPAEVHIKYPQLQNTCPYSESLFGLITIDLKNKKIQIHGKKAEWIGPSPFELGYSILSEAEQGLYLNPKISPRKIN